MPLFSSFIVALSMALSSMTSPECIPAPSASLPAQREVSLYEDVTSSTVAFECTQANVPPVPETPSDDASLGDEVAWLAVQMAGTAAPETRLTNPSHDVWEKIDDPRLVNEFAIMDAVEDACPSFNCAYASCNQAVCGVLAAVVDMDMAPHRNASGSPETMLAWLRNHPDNWMRIDSRDEDDLRPGDVFCGPSHTAIYVGHEVPQDKFPGTTGAVYEASYSAAAYAGIDSFGIPRDAEIYRPIKRNTSSSYPSVDYRAVIASAVRE